jgi:hypothetical protein
MAPFVASSDGAVKGARPGSFDAIAKEIEGEAPSKNSEDDPKNSRGSSLE